MAALKLKSSKSAPALRFAQDDDEELIQSLRQRRRLGNLYNVAAGDRLARRRRPAAELAV
eukprot:CAMPEP_0206408100 /NCGR_PEP_ID=MMETSP0294-20121207/30919_1 /ASSEMBLY_ACC=CAM_ASM_000327 /TAXON_ID=39354 /ORGANISM="Heterosigma akashiwo, Strain CCMP2393" /LENGTH=59 /DNA_ID=CAMNT_0053867437 /DNA_START=50 /DNA_END=226 /DNA_ORIENTATION=-